MSEERQVSLWEELGKIDFLLDELARAVERGDTPRETYDTLAPRHLARREELVAELTAGVPQVAATLAPPPVSHERRARGHVREVRWTQVLAYTGAFLVVVAAAIFTVAVWETVSTTAKLAFLGVFTAAFYAAGVLVWRSGLKGSGVALTAVGSAMLLFDGWIAIDGYGLSGPWPWAALLLVLSAVYWFTEIRLSGRFFGVTGVAAQVGWWWLLGQGLGWTPAPRFAGIAAVAVAWSFAAERVRGQDGFSSLASVLRVAAPVTAVAAAAGVLGDLAIGPPRWIEIASAFVVALAVTVVADRFGRPWRGLAAIAWLPLLSAVAAMTASEQVTWGHVGVLAAAAVFAGGYELLRGGSGHGIAALVFEVAAWVALATALAFTQDATLALLIVVASIWFVGSRMLRDTGPSEELLAPHARAFAPVVAVGGWLLLGGVTLYLPDALYEARLSGWALALPRDVALAGVFTLGWTAAARIMRAWPAAILAAAGSLLTVALLALGLAPELHPAYVACAVAAAVAVWLHVPRLSEGLAAPLLGRGVSWVAGGGLFVFAVGLWLAGPPHAEWPVIALMVAVAAVWASEALRFRVPYPGAAATVALVTAALLAGDLLDAGARQLGSAGGGVAGALAGVALCAAATALARRSGSRYGWWLALPAAGAGSVAAAWPVVMLAGPRHEAVAPALAATFALVAAGWVLCALATRTAWFSAVAALAVWASTLSVLAWLGVAPAVTVAVLTLLALALFAPTLISTRAPGATGLPEVAAPLAFVAVAVASGTVFLGAHSYLGTSLWRGWADLGAAGLIVALTTLGGLLLLSARPYAVEAGEYAGALCVVAAGWVALDAVGVGVLEPYLVLLALYIAGASYRYAARAPGRTVPVVADWAAVACAAWLPALLAVSANTRADAFTHSLWAVGLSLAAIAAGIVLRVRGYLFGGIAALLAVSVWRSFFLLVEFWWAVLGVIGIAMLVIALTWERQQMLLARTGQLVREYFGGWR